MIGSYLLILSIIMVPLLSAQPWDYANQDSWGGVCKGGSMQSPIDIPASTLECSSYDTFSISLDDSARISFEYKDKDWVPLEGTPYGFFEAEDIDGIVQLYKFSGASFHMFSEHQITGQKANLELQLRFTLDESDSPSTTENSTAIISILMNRIQNDTEESGFMHAVDMFLLENNNGSHIVTVKTPQLMSKILIDPQNFIMYQGSLTNPGCDENVNWYVVETPLLIKDAELDLLLNISDSNNTIGNSRNIQPINGRPFKKICAVTLRVETLFQNPAFYFLSVIVIAGFFVWQSYGRIPPEEGKTFYANIWTIHPIVSIIHIPNKESFSRRCRIALLYVTWLIQMIVECIAFRIQGHYKPLYILYFALIGVLFSIPVTYTVGFFFRMYSKRCNENERLMHYDPTAMFRYMRTFKIIALCIIIIGLIFLYWQIAYLIGILAKEWILSFLIGAFIDLCVFDSIAVLLSLKSHKIANLLKLRGYYFEGDISFYNIL